MGKLLKPFLVLDLDGTLIDISEKFKFVFSQITGSDRTNCELFWNLRKEGFSSKQILENHFREVKDERSFGLEWNSLIEEESVISYDTLFPDTKFFLQTMSHAFTLILCTARKQADTLHRQLLNLDINEYFSEVIATKGALTKALVLHHKFSTMDYLPYGYMVGDTVEDINSGFEIGFRTGGILTGLTDRRTFLNLKNCPTVIAENLTEMSILIAESMN